MWSWGALREGDPSEQLGCLTLSLGQGLRERIEALSGGSQGQVGASPPFEVDRRGGNQVGAPKVVVIGGHFLSGIADSWDRLRYPP